MTWMDLLFWVLFGGLFLLVLVRPRFLREFLKPPEQRLRERFQRGEISREEFERRMAILTSHL